MSGTSKAPTSLDRAASSVALGAGCAYVVTKLETTESDVVAAAIVAGSVVISAACPGVVPTVAVVLPVVATAKVLLKHAHKLCKANRLIADDKPALDDFQSVLNAKKLKDVKIIACTELAKSMVARLVGTLNTDFCHDYVLVEATALEDADDASAAGGEPRAHEYKFELHYLNDGNVHLLSPRPGGYEVDADDWYTKKNVPAKFVAPSAEIIEAPKTLLINALEYGFQFAEEHPYCIQRYNCQSFVKTIVQSLKDGKYQLVVDPSIRMWKAFYDGWSKVIGHYDEEAAKKKAVKLGIEYKPEEIDAPAADVFKDAEFHEDSYVNTGIAPEPVLGDLEHHVVPAPMVAVSEAVVEVSAAVVGVSGAVLDVSEAVAGRILEAVARDGDDEKALR